MGKKVFICKKCGLSYNEDKFQNLTTPSRCSCGFTDYFKTDIDVDVWNEMSVIDKNKVRYDVIDYDFLDKRKKIQL